MRLLCLLAGTQGIPVCGLSDIILLETALLLASPILEYGIPWWPQRLIVLHAVYGHNNAGEAGRDMDEEVDGLVGQRKGKEREEGDSFASLFPTHRAPMGIWFLQSLTFLESSIPSESQLLAASLKRAELTARAVGVGSTELAESDSEEELVLYPYSHFHCLVSLDGLLPPKAESLKGFTQDQLGYFELWTEINNLINISKTRNKISKANDILWSLWFKRSVGQDVGNPLSYPSLPRFPFHLPPFPSPLILSSCTCPQSLTQLCLSLPLICLLPFN